jgi:hypothetical protein
LHSPQASAKRIEVPLLLQIELLSDSAKFHGGIRRVEHTQYDLPARDRMCVAILFP